MVYGLFIPRILVLKEKFLKSDQSLFIPHKTHKNRIQTQLIGSILSVRRIFGNIQFLAN